MQLKSENKKSILIFSTFCEQSRTSSMFKSTLALEIKFVKTHLQIKYENSNLNSDLHIGTVSEYKNQG